MKVGFLYGFSAYPPAGGGQTHVYELIRWLQRSGNPVHVVGDSSIADVRNYPITAKGVTEFLKNIDILYIRLDGGFFYREALKKKCMKEATVPIVWEINSPANEQLAFIEGKVGRFEETLIGRTLGLFGLPNKGLRLRGRIIFDELVRKNFAKHVSTAICVSDQLASYAKKKLNFKSVHVLPNASNPEIFSPKCTMPCTLPALEGRAKVFYAGSPGYPWHSFDVMKEVVEKIGKISTDIVFVFLVNQKSPEVPQGKNVFILEKVPYESVASYLLTGFVCLSLYKDYTWSPWGFHGSPIKLFDYMACGMPVIASNFGQIGTIIEDGKNGLLTNNDPDDIVRKILWLYENPEEAKLIGRNARENVEEIYNWQRVAQETVKIFSSVLNQK